jgi:CubicO group peptidase (beta-lactamase class C family)
VSKSFTALAVLQLAEAGQVDLEAPVRQYLPAFDAARDPAKAQITVRHLLTHTSGFSTREGRVPFGATDTASDAMQRRVQALSATSLTAAPGTAFAYSNTNYLLLGALVEAVSGQAYEAYLEEHLFGPLGMTDSYASVSDVPNLAVGHRFLFGRPVAASDLPRTRVSTPSGFLVASAEDVGRYLLALLGGGTLDGATVLSPSGIDALFQPSSAVSETLSYGLGWFVETVDSTVVVQHGGTTESFFAHVVMVPAEGWGGVLLVNGMGYASGPDFPALGRNVQAALLGQAVTPVGPTPLRTILWALGAVLIVQGAGAAHTLHLLRRWRRHPSRRPRLPWMRWGWHGALPLLGCLTLAGIFLVGLPYAFDMTLRGLLLYAPDAGLLAVAGGVLALVWGGVRTGLVARSLVSAQPDSGAPVTGPPAGPRPYSANV